MGKTTVQRRCRSCNKAIFFYEGDATVTCVCGAEHDISGANKLTLVCREVPVKPTKRSVVPSMASNHEYFEDYGEVDTKTGWYTVHKFMDQRGASSTTQ